MPIHQDVCDAYNINRYELAEKLGVSKSTLDSWSDESRMSKVTRLALELMIENHYKTKLLSDLSDALSKIVIYDSRKKENDIGVDNEQKELVARMKRILKEFNLNVIEASKKLNEHSFEQLDQILRLNAYPSFNFLDKFSDTFSISNEWLTTGYGHPFEITRQNKQITSFYIIHSNDNKMPVKIINKYSGGNFYIEKTDYHIEENYPLLDKDCEEIFELYNFYNKNEISIFLTALEREEYDRLMSGEYYPGNILDKGQYSDMLKDLLNLRSDKKEKYGDFFDICICAIQNIINKNEQQEPISSVMTNMPEIL